MWDWGNNLSLSLHTLRCNLRLNITLETLINLSRTSTFRFDTPSTTDPSLITEPWMIKISVKCSAFRENKWKRETLWENSKIQLNLLKVYLQTSIAVTCLGRLGNYCRLDRRGLRKFNLWGCKEALIRCWT